MLSFLPGVICGVISFSFYVLNTVFWCIPLFIVALLKFVLPVNGWRKICNSILIAISSSWVFCNSLNTKLMHKTKWDVKGVEKLTLDDWYLVVSNHQSWVDILVLQKIFHRKIPFLKFFLKKELIWVPVLGLAWWALDFPFMKRYSRAFLKKNPHLKGKDIEITRKACEKFKTTPVSVMNFLEGTRFTTIKHQKQKSSFKRLLKPKAGGIAFVLAAMGEYLHSILNVTITYPQGTPYFWDFLCGRIPEIRIQVEMIPITEDINGDYFEDENFRNHFQEWVNSLWEEKDATVSAMLE